MNGRKKITWIIPVILFAGKNILYGIMADTFDLDLYTLQVITFGTPRNTNADLFNLLIDLFPVFICEFLFGLTIYRHFCTGAVYYFCRQENRLHWFAAEIRNLAAVVLFFSISWFGISWIGGVLIAGRATATSICLLLEAFVLFVLYLFLWSVIMNLCNIFLGSQVAGTAVFAFQIICLFSILLVDNGGLFALNPVANLILSWHSLPETQAAFETGLVTNFPLWFSVLYEVLLIAVVLLIGNQMIRRMDIALENREIQG